MATNEPTRKAGGKQRLSKPLDRPYIPLAKGVRAYSTYPQRGVSPLPDVFRGKVDIEGKPRDLRRAGYLRADQQIGSMTSPVRAGDFLRFGYLKNGDVRIRGMSYGEIAKRDVKFLVHMMSLRQGYGRFAAFEYPKAPAIEPQVSAPAKKPCTETIEVLENLLADARRGKLKGMAFIASFTDNHFIADAAGCNRAFPVRTRGMLKSLDDALSDLIRKNGEEEE